MKTKVVYRIAFLLLILGGTVQAQETKSSDIINVGALQTDLNTLFNELGKEIVPFLQQTAVSGYSMGEAEISDGQHFYLSLATVSATFSDGIGKFLEPGKAKWSFNLIDIPTEVNKLIGTNEFVIASKHLFGYPSVNFGLGFTLFGGFEVLFNGFYIPNSLVGWAVDLAGEGSKAIKDMNPKLDVVNVGGMLRKVILAEKKNSLRPALSVGFGYTYSSFETGLAVKQTIPLPEILGADLKLEGDLSIRTQVHTVGVELHTSKRLLIFTPFIKLGAWYHNSQFTTQSTLAVSAPEKANPNNKLIDQKIAIDAKPTISDISVLFTGGMELKLLILVISPSVTINLQNPDIRMENFGKPLDFVLKGMTGRVGVRLQL